MNFADSVAALAGFFAASLDGLGPSSRSATAPLRLDPGALKHFPKAVSSASREMGCLRITTSSRLGACPELSSSIQIVGNFHTRIV